jgi:uncharacterized protein (TIGR03083 family)
MPMDRDAHLAHLEADIEAFAAAIDSGPPAAPVPWCGRWTVADLGRHLGEVHRWARGAVVHATAAGAAAEEEADPAPDDPAALGAWLRDGGERLVAALRALGPDDPTWHPFPAPRVGAIWPRRQAQETSVHRWDAQRAIGMTPTIDAALAADGVDEYFVLALPRLIAREGVAAPSTALLVEATDTHDRWLVAARDGTVVVHDARSGSETPAMSIRGRAEDVLLALWRRPIDDDALALAGDPLPWLELGGI